MRYRPPAIVVPTSAVERLCVLISVTAALCLPLSAQTTAPSIPAATEANPSLSPLQVNVDAVAIDMVARDSKNRPVVDLTPADIAVSDAGNPVELSGMHLVTARSGG